MLAGNACWSSTVPLDCGNANATWTNVPPDAKGPAREQGPDDVRLRRRSFHQRHAKRARRRFELKGSRKLHLVRALFVISSR